MGENYEFIPVVKFIMVKLDVFSRYKTCDDGITQLAT